ncbi:MAG: copper resistance protein B [Thiomicrospira sp.]|uniref:copper resistance protein B n=1 Tax=Thiomicrospira sp. TaxID=935 RepID=UPI0019DF4DFE|nr:copper resistance protein B [Thiomicrospira sp.]MBE0493431.1 copper resistance protein B [Thiomicrospira sp.]
MFKKTLIYSALLSIGVLTNHQAWSQQDPEPMVDDHGSMQGGSAPADARDPLDYSGDLRYNDDDLQRLHLMDQHVYKAFMVDHVEQVFTDDTNYTAYELKAWIGKDYNKLQFQSEGSIKDGEFEAHSELYWSHAIAAYWDSLIGVRFDSGDHERQWLAFGVQGLAPYMIDTSAKAFIDEDGRVAAKLEFKYEMMFTQDLELEPKIKAKLFSSKDTAFGEGAGLAELKAGLRLKYHIKPEFAPYIGVEWKGLFGETKDFANQAGHATSETRYMVGLSFWY